MLMVAGRSANRRQVLAGVHAGNPLSCIISAIKGLRQYNRVRNILELSSRNREKQIKNHKKKKGKVLKQAREKR